MYRLDDLRCCIINGKTRMRMEEQTEDGEEDGKGALGSGQRMENMLRGTLLTDLCWK